LETITITITLPSAQLLPPVVKLQRLQKSNVTSDLPVLLLQSQMIHRWNSLPQSVTDSSSV